MSAAIAARIEKLHAARLARQQLLEKPIDQVTRHARLASILACPDADNRRHTRICAIFAFAQQRRDHEHLA